MFTIGLRKKYRDEVNTAFENLKKLLKMWKDFHNFKPKYSASLKNSTTIPFNLWQQVTDLLLNNDESDICSLFFNINQLYILNKTQKLLNVYGFNFFSVIKNESCLKNCYIFFSK